MCTNEVPVAHTPQGGFRENFPELVLGGCGGALSDDAPDLRGLWRVVQVWRGGELVESSDRFYSYVERIEQCGNRIIDMGGGTIADARADGTEENGVQDVSAFDYTTPIHVTAHFEDKKFILRPVGIPGIEITRYLDDEGFMMWTRPDLANQVIRLVRDGDGAGTPVNSFPRLIP